MNEKWFFISLSCHPDVFREAFGSPNILFKSLSNSKKKIGYVTQRIFWQSNVSGGFYYCIPLPSGEVHFGLLGFLSKDLSKTQLDIRLKNFFPRSLWPYVRIEKWEGQTLQSQSFPISLSSFPFLLNFFGALRGRPEKVMNEVFGRVDLCLA